MPSSPSVFISYSTQDETAARTVRNLFEERGHDALLLKLQQHMSNEFIMELLRKELQARDWLVKLDSPQSRQSDWVAYEDVVARLLQKPIFHVDAECASDSSAQALQSCLRTQVNKISRKLRVFISSSHSDQAVATRIADALQAVGYETWQETAGISVGSNWVDAIQNAIDTTLEQGVMLVLVSANSVNSRWVQEEIEYGLRTASRRGGLLIPVLIPPKAALPLSLATHQALDMSQDLDLGIERLLRLLQSA